MNNDHIIQKIKNENIRPISKNTFVVKKIVLWFSFVMSTIFGAYAFAFFFLKTLYIDFDNWYYFSNTYNRFLMENIPIIWIVLFVVSLALMFFLFKKTDKGYKYSIFFVGFISLIISFSLGIILSKALAYNGLLVDRFEKDRFMSWTNPEEGRLSGEILFVDSRYVLLRDIRNEVWNINTKYLLDNSRQNLGYSKIVSVIGQYDYAGNFTACQIVPLHMDKVGFRPDQVNQFYIKSSADWSIIDDICDFVINKN